MWIAKPIHSLTEAEQSSWEQMEPFIPLAQTLNWARAIGAVSGKAYLIFSPDEMVGGVVFSTVDFESGRIQFECVNGPFLHWDDPKSAPRQLATFALAVSRLDSQFSSLKLKPRWESETTQRRLGMIPVSSFQMSHAATSIISVSKTAEEQLGGFSSRLRRSILIAQKNSVAVEWESMTPALLESFVPRLRSFGEIHQFTVPPMEWFLALVEKPRGSKSSLSFWRVTSRYRDDFGKGCFSQAMMVLMGDRAFYLFGFEERDPDVRSAISTAAVIHWETLTRCRALGVTEYDLNGFVPDADPSHPYFGVSEFKKQFVGKIVSYDIPELVIEARETPAFRLGRFPAGQRTGV